MLRVMKERSVGVKREMWDVERIGGSDGESKSVVITVSRLVYWMAKTSWNPGRRGWRRGGLKKAPAETKLRSPFRKEPGLRGLWRGCRGRVGLLNRDAGNLCGRESARKGCVR